MSPHNMARQAEHLAERPYFVLEEVTQRLNEFKAEFIWQTTDVVVQFDVGGGPGMSVSGLDDIGVQRPLSQKMHWITAIGGDLIGGLPEAVDEPVSDQATFLLRILDTGEVTEKLVGCINHSQVDIEVVLECRFDQSPFILSQQAVVDKDAGQAIADGAGEQGRHDRRINATTETADHTAFPDKIGQQRTLCLHEIGHPPRAAAATHFVEKVAEQVDAMWRMSHFWVELQTVEPTLVMHHRCGRTRIGRRDDFEFIRKITYLITMAHPHRHVLRKMLKQSCCPLDHQLRASVLACLCPLNRRPEQMASQLHAVADPKHRNAHVEDGRIAPRRPRFVDAGRAAR